MCVRARALVLLLSDGSLNVPSLGEDTTSGANNSGHEGYGGKAGLGKIGSGSKDCSQHAETSSAGLPLYTSAKSDLLCATPGIAPRPWTRAVSEVGGEFSSSARMTSRAVLELLEY